MGAFWNNFCLIRIFNLRKQHRCTHIHSQLQSGGTASVAKEGGGLKCGPPASITWDIFYMIEPSVWNWTHVTTFRELVWVRMCIFGRKFAQGLQLCAPSCTPLCLLHQQVIPNNWWIGIEVLMRKRQTEAEMKHWLLVQIALITISTLKLCNNLYSTCFIEVGREKKEINAYLQCFWINISLRFRIIIFWSHFKKAGDYTLITYCMVGNVSAGDK